MIGIDKGERLSAWKYPGKSGTYPGNFENIPAIENIPENEDLFFEDHTTPTRKKGIILVKTFFQFIYLFILEIKLIL